MVKIYGRINCFNCDLVKKLLTENNIEFEYVDVDNGLPSNDLDRFSALGIGGHLPIIETDNSIKDFNGIAEIKKQFNIE